MKRGHAHMKLLLRKNEVCTIGASVEIRMRSEENASSVGWGLAPDVGKYKCAFAMADDQWSPLRFVFVCIRVVVLAASFVGACTARPHIHAVRDDIQPVVDDILAFGEMICHCRAMDTNNDVFG